MSDSLTFEFQFTIETSEGQIKGCGCVGLGEMHNLVGLIIRGLIHGLLHELRLGVVQLLRGKMISFKSIKVF